MLPLSSTATSATIKSSRDVIGHIGSFVPDADVGRFLHSTGFLRPSTSKKFANTTVIQALKGRNTLVSQIIQKNFSSTIAPVFQIKEIAHSIKKVILSATRVDNSSLATVVSTFPKLEALKLNYCSKLTSEGFLKISALSDLRELSLSGTKVRTSTLNIYFRTLPYLSKLELDCCPRLKEEDLEMEKPYASLQELDLSYTDIDDHFLHNIAKCFPNLRDLNLETCKTITSDGFQKLLPLQFLLDLNISHTFIDDTSLTMLTQAAQSLLILDVTGCKNISNECVEACTPKTSFVSHFMKLNVQEKLEMYLTSKEKLSYIGIVTSPCTSSQELSGKHIYTWMANQIMEQLQSETDQQVIQRCSDAIKSNAQPYLTASSKAS